jgi:hypothetical protein
MKWLWNNNIILIYSGAGLIGLGFASALFALIGFSTIFHLFSLGSLTTGLISILCGLIIFCLQFGLRSNSKKVIAFALLAQGLLGISFFLFHASIDFYSRLYSPWVGFIFGGLWFVSIEMAALLLVIGLVRLFFYTPRQS